jgi:AraC family transcriptional regulator
VIRGIGEISLMQEDGSSPTVSVAGTAPGESGISVLRMQFEGGVHFSASPRHHLIWFQLSDVLIECRRAARSSKQRAPAGSLAICPAGIDCAADAKESADAIVVSLDPGRLSLAAAEDLNLDVRLHERWLGFDQALLGLARTLALESARGYPDGAPFWNTIAHDFIAGLISRHSSGLASQVRGTLGKAVLARIRKYILDHIDERIDVAALAEIAGRSPFHFSRVFARSVGVTPHRYIIHLRLQRAVEVVREGRCGLAEIAARTGFADQSHLSRWVRRVHGVSLTQLAV